jgi:tetratricopeptide (TPR) repeat protein
MSTEQTETTEPTTASQAASALGVDNAIERVRTQWKAIVGIVVVAVFALGGYFWYSSNQAQKNEEGLTQLARIRSTFDMGDFSKALSGDSIPPVGDEKVMGLLAISDEYSGTDAGSIAALMAGNALLNLGRFNDAQAQFERAQSSGAQVVEVGALQGLASVKESAKDYAGAAELYEKAASVGAKSGLDDRCLYNAGLCYERAGNTAKAGELYRLVVKKFEMSEVSASARGGLARLGMAID